MKAFLIIAGAVAVGGLPPAADAQVLYQGAGPARYDSRVEYAQPRTREDRAARTGTVGASRGSNSGLTFEQIQTLQQSLRDQQLSSVPRDLRDRRSIIGQ